MKEKLKTSQTWGETGTLKFTKLKDHPHYLNAKQSSPTRITIKLSKFKNKERILKQQEDKRSQATKERPLSYQWIS